MFRVVRVMLALVLFLGLVVVGDSGTGAAAATKRPTITAVSPAVGPLAQRTLTISGKHLKRVNAVKFGSTRGKIVRKISSTKVQVLTPAAVVAGTVTVEVRVGKKWSRASSKSKYTFVAVPRITAIAPNSGPVTAGQPVTISGSNLGLTSRVTFGSQSATLLSRSTTKVVVRPPAGAVGSTLVRVLTVGGMSGPLTFSYTNPTPTPTPTTSSPAPTDPPATDPAANDLQMTLSWAGPADLDLRVVEPSGAELNYLNDQSASGGVFEGDANAGCNPPSGANSEETAFWAPSTAPAGSYKTRVVVQDECDDSDPISWKLVIRSSGQVVLNKTGTGNSAEFAINR